jgi:predicted flap endonuclease-1-like 5' DNA nuclease
MANYKIEDIEGIGAVVGKKLRAAGVKDTDTLLAHARGVSQRKKLAEVSGLSAQRILKFANMADLYRVRGIGSEYSELLEASGVDTVPDLARRSAENLVKRMSEVNAEKKLTRKVPTLAEVTKWIAEAKKLPRALTY